MPGLMVLFVTPQDPAWRQHKARLRLPPGVEIIGDTDDPREAVALASRCRPDVIVIASVLRGSGSVPVVGELREASPASRIVVVAEGPTYEERLGYEGLDIFAYLGRDEVSPWTLRQCLDPDADPLVVMVSRAAAWPPEARSEPPVTVLVGERGDLIRLGLRALFDADPHFTVVGERMSDLLAAAERFQPDLIVIDPRADDSLDVERIRALHRASPRSRIAILTSAYEPHIFLDAMQARVHACMLETPGGSGAPILEALLLVGRRGWVVVDGTIAEDFWTRFPELIHLQTPRPGAPSVTQHQRELLELLAAGLTNGAIAKQLAISDRTVESIITHLLDLLKARNRTNLAAIAVRDGYVPL